MTNTINRTGASASASSKTGLPGSPKVAKAFAGAQKVGFGVVKALSQKPSSQSSSLKAAIQAFRDKDPQGQVSRQNVDGVKPFEDPMFKAPWADNSA